MKSVSIKLCIPGRALRSVSIDKGSHVSDLLNYMPHGSYTFFYSGNLLTESMSLEFYGIKNQDCIVALNIGKERCSSPQKLAMWKRITKDQNEFNEKLKNIMNPSASLELTRLQDLRLCIQTNTNRTFYRKFLKFRQLNDFENRSQLPKTSFKYSKPKEPQSEPLPAFWNVK